MKQTNNYIIEIATTDFISTQEAVAGGADRIELCAALCEGGTTASMGMIRLCREKFETDLFPIIRPRGGDFLYTAEEFDVMVQDVILCRELGCNGIVTGLLQSDGSIDIRRTTLLIEKAFPMEVTFHRAFDRSRDPFEAMEQLISIGCQRILTSGQSPEASQGLDLIAELVRQADERIIIMPGSGVRKDNINEIRQKTGAFEFHSSLRGKIRSNMQFMHPAFAASEESYKNPFVHAHEVKELREALGN